MKISILILVFSFIFSACSTWDKKEFLTDKNGEIYRLKLNSEACVSIKKMVTNIYSLSETIMNNSNKNAFSCIDGNRNEEYKNQLVLVQRQVALYKELEMELVKKGIRINSCFGSDTGNFIYNQIGMSHLNFMYSIYYCSSQIDEIFKKSRNPSEFDTKAQKFLKEILLPYEIIHLK